MTGEQEHEEAEVTQRAYNPEEQMYDNVDNTGTPVRNLKNEAGTSTALQPVGPGDDATPIPSIPTDLATAALNAINQLDTNSAVSSTDKPPTSVSRTTSTQITDCLQPEAAPYMAPVIERAAPTNGLSKADNIEQVLIKLGNKPLYALP